MTLRVAISGNRWLTTPYQIRLHGGDPLPYWRVMEEEEGEVSGQLSHPELLAKANAMLSTLLADPFLSDLSHDVSAEEVSSIVALEEGKAITVFVRRFDQELIRECTDCLLGSLQGVGVFTACLAELKKDEIMLLQLR